jgi:hypothetical protein
LDVLPLVVIVCPGGVLQAEFPGSNFVQPINHLVFKMFNLIFKDADFSRELVSEIFKPSTARVSVLTSICAVSRAALSFYSSCFRSVKALAVELGSPKTTPMVMCCSMKAA